MDRPEFESHEALGGVVLLTPEGYKRLHDELEHLTTVKRHEIAERLRESKDHGEFAEDNSELDETKFEQAMVESRITELKTIFSNAQVLDADHIPTDEVGVGSVVKVMDVDRKFDFEVRIVSSIEANPDEDLISNESPMGLALMGASKDEVVEFVAPAGKLRYQIVSISK